MITMLIVEDEPAIARAIKKLIHSLTSDFMVQGIANNGKEALEQVKILHPDVIITDIRMPVMDGIQAAKTIRAMNRPDAQKVIILAMTAQTAQECVDECSRSGMNGHIAKPMESRQLVKQILEDM